MDIGPSAPVGWDGIEHHVYVSRSDNIINSSQQRVNTRQDALGNGDWWYHFFNSNITSIAHYNFYGSNGELICSNNRSFTSYHIQWWCINDKELIDSITTLVVTYSH
jgi:hypothetical protein